MNRRLRDAIVTLLAQQRPSDTDGMAPPIHESIYENLRLEYEAERRKSRWPKVPTRPL